MNLEYVGAEANFTVLAGVSPEYELEFTRDGQPLPVSGVTFDGVLVDADGNRQELVIHHAGLEENVLRVTFPHAEKVGRFDYEIAYTTQEGARYRLAYGVLQVLSTELLLEETSGLEFDSRRLQVRLPGAAGGHVQLVWRAGMEIMRAVEEARVAAEKLAGVDETLAQLDAQVQEFRGFIVQWKDDLPSVLIMNPVTGTIWVGNTDTGQPYRGEDGKAPRVNARGFWEVFRDGRWVELDAQAFGRDGIDGTAFRFILVDSYEDIPQSGETCNGGFRYLVKHEGWAAVGEPAATGNGEWEAWEMPAYLLPSEFTHLRVPGALNENGTAVYLMVRTTDGEVLGVSQNAVTWAVGDVVTWEFAEPVRVPNGAVVQMFLRRSNEGVTGTVPNEGVLMKSLLGNEGVCRVRYHSQWYGGRTPYLLAWGAGASEFYDEYAWVEQDGSASWVRLPRVGELATAQVYGAMMYGTDMRVVGGAPLGRDASGRAHVPLASSTVPGALRPSSPEVNDVGGGTHMSVSGSLLVDLARLDAAGAVRVSTSEVLTAGGLIGLNADGQLLVRLATPDLPGAVLPGSRYLQLTRRPYLLSVGVDGQGHLANCLVGNGALQHKRKEEWMALKGQGYMLWMNDADFLVDGAHYLGMVTSGQFGQDEEEGLTLLPATADRLAGVYLVTAPAEATRPAQTVLPLSVTETRYAHADNVYDKAAADEWFMSTKGGVVSVKLCKVGVDLPPANEQEKGMLYIGV